MAVKYHLFWRDPGLRFVREFGAGRITARLIPDCACRSTAI